MPLNPELSIAAQTPFTPAERAMLVEKSEALKVALDAFINNCKNEDSQHMMESMIPVAQEWEAIHGLVADKLKRTITNGLLDSLGGMGR